MADPITLVTEIAAHEDGSPEDAIAIKEDLLALRDVLEEVSEAVEAVAKQPGPPGEPGGDGAPGADGLAGADGADGAPGADGRDGAPGADGKDGVDGERGPPGADGAPGTDGKDGAPGADGLAGAHGRDGAPGEPGADGRDGAPGADGAPGRDGIDGRDGERGPPGADGADGADGKDGLDGKPGADGARGPRGEAGLNGDAGKPGRDGDRGPRGADGRDGADGKDGINGFDGQAGADGASFTWRGGWQPTEYYDRNDVVRRNGSIYIALSPNTGSKPHLKSGDWDLMVAKGATGPAGPAGSGGGGGGGAASDITVTNPGYANVQEVLDALLYVALTINSFTGGGNFEIGSTVNSVNLAWSYNKAVTSQSINQGIGSLDIADRAEALTGLGLTTNRTWTLSATDGTTPRTANTTVSFLPKRYWGPFADDAPDNSEILGLSQELASGRAKTVVYDCTGGRFPIYAWPKSFGNLSGVTVNNLAFSDYTVSEMSFTNASGHTQDYYVFTFNGIQTGSNISVAFS